MVGRGRGGRRGGRGGRSQRESLNNDGYLQSQQSNGASQTYFSLSEEARYTERHHLWNSDLKLRHSRVAFVSAGTSSAEELTKAPQKKSAVNGDVRAKDKETARAPESQPAAPIVTLEAPMSKVSLSDAPFAKASESGSSQKFESSLLPTSGQSLLGKGEPNTEMSNDVFFTDLKGAGQCTHMGLLPPSTRRSPSPVASDSSDEIILFVGRKSSQSEPHKTTSQTINSGGMSEQNELTHSLPLELLHQPIATIIDDSIEDNTKDSTSVLQHTFPDQQMPNIPKPTVPHMQDLGNGDLTSIPGKRRRGKRRNRHWQTDEETQILADYIANTNESDDLDGFANSFGLNQRELGGSDNAEWEDEETASMSEQQRNVPLRGLDEWDITDLQDFDGISTSSEALDNVERVLLSRRRPSGVQYLVVGQGHKIDDARWLSLAALDVRGADEKIRIFDEEQAEIERLLGECDSSEKSMSLDEQLTLDIQEDTENLEDEEDLVDRRKARATDEQIARLLSKQEELGLGSDNLRLFDGGGFDGGDEVEAQLDGMWDGVVTFQDQTKSKRKKRAPPSFPSATALAGVLDRDPYNGFDVMDQDRPSLRRKPKGRRRNLPMELSDSELELQMHMAWENDRSKKKKRKQEREELRTQGLLGKKGKPDLKFKYPEGISMVEVKSEIKDFLLSSMESLSLPPMAHRERKMVHEIANIFKLKSKSIGSGTSRFPVLYRTSRTTQYNEDALGAIEALLSSRCFLPRMDKGKKKKGTSSAKARGGRGFASAGVSYRDGEVVGATAPELGQDNKGRAMLEKMGWSTGTTLGALNNNRGIVQPVAQVVKTGKAGLG